MVEADITGFFDNIDHQWMMRMLEQRIDDKPFLGLIKKGLKAGLPEEDGQVLHPVTGTPPGGVVSPILAHVYWQYALDLWFETVVKKERKGAGALYRDADDLVCVAQYKVDAARFYRILPQRLGTFKLHVAVEKTRLVRCSRYQPGTSVDCLGFACRWDRSSAGKPVVQCRPSRKKCHRSLANFRPGWRENRSLPRKRRFGVLHAKRRGYSNDYGITGNDDSLKAFFSQARHILRPWLNRRSQKRRYTGQCFAALLKRYRIERPRITDTPQRQPALSWAFADCGRADL